MEFDVIINGGGVVGSAFALALRESGLKAALIAAHPPEPPDMRWDSRVYALSPGSAAFLDACGAWTHLAAERVTRIEDMRIFGDDAAAELGFSAYEAGLHELAHVVEHGRLQSALSTALQGMDDAIAVFSPASCSALTISDHGVALELQEGRCLHARLIVGADGAESWTRAQAGIAVTQYVYHQAGVVANFRAAEPHRETAFQWFRPDGVLALLPLPDNHVSMVWSTAEAHAERLMDMAPGALAEEVAAASRGMLGALDSITPAARFPLRLQRVRNLVRPRLALIGDAAHNVHPLAGQGLNLGLRDARELADTLAKRAPHIDCGDYYLLRRYERARREDILAMQLTTDGLQKLFSSDDRWLGRARNFGLRMTDRQSRLKNLLVQRAVG